MTHTTTDAAEARALTPEAVAAAIKATEYKYFGDYEMSDDQREAVDVLVEVARHRLATAEAASGAGEREAFVRLCEALGIPATAGAYLEVPRLLASLPPATDPAMGLDPATVERCANVVGPREGGQYSWLANRIRALAAAPTIPTTGEAK